MESKLRQAINDFISDGDDLTSQGFCAMSENLPAISTSGERLIPLLTGPSKDAITAYLRWLDSRTDGFDVSKLLGDYRAIRKQLVAMQEAEPGSATKS